MPDTPVPARTRTRRFSFHRSLRLALIGALVLPTAAAAESSVRLEAGALIEALGATTFDAAGRAIGRSHFEVETEADGSRLMRVEMATDDGGRNVSQALLAPVAGGLTGGSSADGLTLRLLEERSQSTTADGRRLPLLVIDHRTRRVSCYDDGAPDADGRHVDLPDEDRVVNVPMQLLFLPLVRGEVDSVRFQIATCGDGPVIHDMIAVRGSTRKRGDREIVEVEYGPDFGKTVAWLASRLLPSFSFWFDANDGAYLGHRMPLHRQGPEITLVRQGLTPPEIGID